LKERLCQALIDQTQTGNRTAYKALADGIGLELPQTIHRLGEALKMGRCMSECDSPASDSLLWLPEHLTTFLNGPADVADRRNNTMTARHMVGTETDGKTSSVTVDAEDALIAALKAKQTNPAAMITYVRKHNVRGDRRHPHFDVSRARPDAAAITYAQGAGFPRIQPKGLLGLLKLSNRCGVRTGAGIMIEAVYDRMDGDGAVAG
jgi:hypothetical protein